MNSVAKAATIAACYVLMMYLVIIHLFVLWKWETSPEIDEIYMPVEYDDNNFSMHRATASSIPGHPERTDIDGLLRKVEEETQPDNNNNNVIIEQTSSPAAALAYFFAKLMEWDNDRDVLAWSEKNSDLLSLPQGNKTIHDLKISSLLYYSALSEFTEEGELTSIFENVLTEFDELVEQKAHLDWQRIQNILDPLSGPGQNKYPTKQKLSPDDLHHMICALSEEQVPELETTVQLAEDQDLSLYANEEELEDTLRALKQILQQREQHFIAHLEQHQNAAFVPNTLEKFTKQLKEDLDESQTFVNNEIEKILAQMATASDAQRDVNRCVAEDDIFALVEEGLDTIARRGDLRVALLQKLTDLDPMAAKDLILDAVLENRNPIPEPRPAQSLNLRRFVDTPTLKCLARSVDFLVDWIRDYTDQLDGYLDGIAVKVGMQGESPGQIIVMSILKYAGFVQLPLPPKAQQLLMRSDKGTYFLAR